MNFDLLVSVIERLSLSVKAIKLLLLKNLYPNSIQSLLTTEFKHNTIHNAFPIVGSLTPQLEMVIMQSSNAQLDKRNSCYHFNEITKWNR